MLTYQTEFWVTVQEFYALETALEQKTKSGLLCVLDRFLRFDTLHLHSSDDAFVLNRLATLLLSLCLCLMSVQTNLSRPALFVAQRT